MLPSMPDHVYWVFRIVPIGAARLVTKEIMAKRKNIAMIAISLPLVDFV